MYCLLVGLSPTRGQPHQGAPQVRCSRSRLVTVSDAGGLRPGSVPAVRPECVLVHPRVLEECAVEVGAVEVGVLEVGAGEDRALEVGAE
jgi:hypothetical protein